jgi:hypothetical protein
MVVDEFLRMRPATDDDAMSAMLDKPPLTAKDNNASTGTELSSSKGDDEASPFELDVVST